VSDRKPFVLPRPLGHDGQVSDLFLFPRRRDAGDIDNIVSDPRRLAQHFISTDAQVERLSRQNSSPHILLIFGADGYFVGRATSRSRFFMCGSPRSFRGSALTVAEDTSKSLNSYASTRKADVHRILEPRPRAKLLPASCGVIPDAI